MVLWSQVSAYRLGDRARTADRVLASSDLAAFYCAALAARHGMDPYKTASLEACQQDRAYRPGGLTFEKNGVNPAPLPTYDFALFAPLTYLPYRTAGLLWIAILIAANFAGSFVLAKLTRLPFGLIAAILAVTDGLLCYTFGQEEPIELLAIVAAALLLRTDRPQTAAAVASLALIEPHVGLPIVAALALWRPAMRLTLATCAAAFAVVALLLSGLATNVEYFSRVLPVHAFAEIPVWFQYSLTSMLYTLGVPGVLALRIASIQYALTCALGIALAGPLAKRIGSPALVLFPAACAVVGGPFIHITQISSAIPFAIYVAAFVPEYRVLGWIATVLVALQLNVSSTATHVFAIVVTVGAAIYALAPRPFPVRVAVGVAAFALYLGLSTLSIRTQYANLRALPSDAQIAVATARFDPTLASTDWAIHLRHDAARSEVSLRRIAQRLPTWLGLLVIIGLGLAIRSKRAADQRPPLTVSR